MLYEVLVILEEEDADMSKFLWAHADKEGGNIEAIKAGIAKGIWIGFDMIKDGTYDEKLKLVQFMVDNGHSDQLLLSQDYDFYEEYETKGTENPCSTFFTKFLPLCYENGLNESIMTSVLSKKTRQSFITLIKLNRAL